MRLSNRIKIPVAALFVACEIALYITFMAGSLDYDTDIAVKYSSVCICAFFALLCCYSLEPTDFLLLGAMVFTIVSDWFLLVTGENIVVGLSTFIVAQLLHFVRISIIRRKVPIVSIILRVVIPVVAIVVMAFMDDLLCAETVLVAIYFSQLVMNFADSIVLCKKSRLYILLCVGMFLFICCDINVGLYNLSAVTDVKLSSSVINFAEYAMWAF
ncbi:MAG: lysoplasmalogenase family protein, partial [Clostridia bacterium]|nr:lysoplasmalogenase family protein [Clostridia bacterium]